MTTITINWRELSLTAKGHACAGNFGEDIVCAGISALTQALLDCLLEAEERGRISLKWGVDVKKATITMTANPKMDYRQEIRDYFKFCRTGLRAIQENYSKHIKILEIQEG